ncbi:MAG: hypothetical protein ACRD3E_06835 [Terriglobales bacterium]
MRNIYDVIREKEAEIEQLQKQVEALRLAARILSEESKPEPVREPLQPVRPAVRSVVPPPAANDTEIVIGAPLRQFP